MNDTTNETVSIDDAAISAATSVVAAVYPALGAREAMKRTLAVADAIVLALTPQAPSQVAPAIIKAAPPKAARKPRGPSKPKAIPAAPAPALPPDALVPAAAGDGNAAAFIPPPPATPPAAMPFA